MKAKRVKTHQLQKYLLLITNFHIILGLKGGQSSYKSEMFT